MGDGGGSGGGGEGRGGGQSNGPFSVSHKLGSEKWHGTPSEDEVGGGGGRSSCWLFFSHFFAGSHVFSSRLRGPSLGLSLAYVLLFFFFFLLLFFNGGVSGRRVRLAICPFLVQESFWGLYLSVLEAFWGPDSSISPLCLAGATQACLLHSSPQTAADSGRSLMDPVYWSRENAWISQIKCHLKHVF